MIKLDKQLAMDILLGCTLLGTGGGGSLKKGIEMIEEDYAQGKEVKLISVSELPDDGYVATPYGCGAPKAENYKENEHLSMLPHLKDSAAVLAFKKLEKYMKKNFFAVFFIELGGENTAEALHIAAQLDKPLVDGDPAGRSVPELQHSTYFIKGIPIFPMAVTTNFGESVIIENVCDDFRAEEIIRSIAVVSGDEVGVADHPMRGSDYKASIIPGAITYAGEIGKLLRTAKEKGEDPAKEVADKCDGSIRFKGEVEKFEYVVRDGFNIGEIIIGGRNKYVESKYRILIKNENMVSYRNGKPDVIIPDLICMLDEEGVPITTPDFDEGSSMTVLALPAPEIWTSEEGLKVFGPGALGYDLDYRPFKV